MFSDLMYVALQKHNDFLHLVPHKTVIVASELCTFILIKNLIICNDPDQRFRPVF